MSTQFPPQQRSDALVPHEAPSALGAYWHPPAPHEPTWHGVGGGQEGPGTQTPPSQASPVVQEFPSVQVVPFGTAV